MTYNVIVDACTKRSGAPQDTLLQYSGPIAEVSGRACWMNAAKIIPPRVTLARSAKGEARDSRENRPAGARRNPAYFRGQMLAVTQYEPIARNQSSGGAMKRAPCRKRCRVEPSGGSSFTTMRLGYLEPKEKRREKPSGFVRATVSTAALFSWMLAAMRLL